MHKVSVKEMAWSSQMPLRVGAAVPRCSALCKIIDPSPSITPPVNAISTHVGRLVGCTSNVLLSVLKGVSLLQPAKRTRRGRACKVWARTYYVRAYRRVTSRLPHQARNTTPHASVGAGCQRDSPDRVKLNGWRCPHGDPTCCVTSTIQRKQQPQLRRCEQQ